jgi:hypothetical protein
MHLSRAAPHLATREPAAPLHPDAATARAMGSNGSGRVIALDFDGVVCDSVGESSLSAFKVRTRMLSRLVQQA